MSKIRLWAIFTVVAVVAAFGIGYFALISPQKAQVTKLTANAATIQQTNDGLRTTVLRFKKDEKDLPAAQARIAQIETRIPATPAVPSYVRWLVTAAANAHVELVSIAPGTPAPVLAKAPAAAPAPAAAGSTAAPAPAAPAASALSSITISYNIVGNYFAVQAFLKQLESSPRATVVSTINVAPGALPKGTGGPSGAAPPQWQTLNAQITATIYMSALPAVAAAAATAATPSPAVTGAAPAAPAGSTAVPNS
jgi:Tfp pilus assembly protein PilO